MPGNDPVATGIAVFLAISFGPAVLLWLLLRVPTVVRRIAAAHRRRRCPPPTGPPLERLVADLRRLHHLVLAAHPPAPPTTRVRRLAVLAAYDDVLLATCRAVGIDDPPLRAWVEDGGTAGALDAGRDLARLRTEAELETTGVRIDPPGPAAA
ncbi:hypothetical protein H7X46_03400 [Pseudonocardia sp. C8]|uniref:hypothetical protein n=1 Tax=Pseudonocardia sp. C8 TaxID=2762759 RepID=UPI0016435FBA|nr:hypothetical protein [Pseudonocardia sp. C8]MBC3190107.1 hypothetical protein [Pseudonocardia sp. C8]